MNRNPLNLQDRLLLRQLSLKRHFLCYETGLRETYSLLMRRGMVLKKGSLSMWMIRGADLQRKGKFLVGIHFPCSHEELAQEEYHIQYPSETGEEEDVSTSEQPSITEVASMRGSPHSSTSSSTTSLPKSEDEFVVIALDESGGKNKKMGPREGHEA
ncbi:hypothetical protein M7I_4436 [Glarea lozoyensis 74030]|uniref:Uncharacterized protein n=1 Tax=Glarea lozoyensis (strain ATCC 74030 / MF5533) TaxID=1104152 RepID=H0EP66_GLAL7|nr:hypothetical protein M7I_4436 [Glarea lozoyensis 74030]